MYIALASKRLDICPEKFAAHAKEIQEAWKDHFPWCVSIHHWVKHVPEIMRILPPTIKVWMLSEVCFIVSMPTVI